MKRTVFALAMLLTAFNSPALAQMSSNNQSMGFNTGTVVNIGGMQNSASSYRRKECLNRGPNNWATGMPVSRMQVSFGHNIISHQPDKDCP